MRRGLVVFLLWTSFWASLAWAQGPAPVPPRSPDQVTREEHKESYIPILERELREALIEKAKIEAQRLRWKAEAERLQKAIDALQKNLTPKPTETKPEQKSGEAR